MTDIRTKALALSALKNEVQIGWDELRDCYVAVIDNRKVAVSEEIDIGLIELYAEAAKVLGLDPDEDVMALLEVCEFALEGENFLDMCGYESSSFRWDCKEWRKTLALKAREVIAKARGDGAE